jgi:hypothetical protein
MIRPLSGRRKYKEVITEAELNAQKYDFGDYQTTSSPTIRQKNNGITNLTTVHDGIEVIATVPLKETKIIFCMYR